MAKYSEQFKREKFHKLMEIEGYEDEMGLLEKVFDTVVPAICMNKDCDYSEEMEPDQDAGWCPECKTNTLCSCLVLANII